MSLLKIKEVTFEYEITNEALVLLSLRPVIIISQ